MSYILLSKQNDEENDTKPNVEFRSELTKINVKQACCTVEDIKKFYDYNYYDFYWIRIVIIPNNTNVFNPTELYTPKFKFDKCILSDKYPLYSINTIKKFNLEITHDYISNLWLYGHVDILEWIKNNRFMCEYNKIYLSGASGNGHVHVLDWWLKSNLPLEYSEKALDMASYNGHVNVLDWWLKSNLPLKYDENALNWASEKGRIHVLEWWKNSGLL